MSDNDVKAESVARYLRDNPGFFEQYGEVLAQIQLPHPHGGRAISLADRQMLGLREKNKALEGKLGELIQFGEENDTISERVHRLSVALIGARSLEEVLITMDTHLREGLHVPYVGVRLWRDDRIGVGFEATTAELRQFCEALSAPYCGGNQNFEAAGWFGDAASRIRSLSLVPLRDNGESFGLLCLASEEPERFYSDMGTLYVERIGDLVGAALLRNL